MHGNPGPDHSPRLRQRKSLTYVWLYSSRCSLLGNVSNLFSNHDCVWQCKRSKCLFWSESLSFPPPLMMTSTSSHQAPRQSSLKRNKNDVNRHSIICKKWMWNITSVSSSFPMSCGDWNTIMQLYVNDYVLICLIVLCPLHYYQTVHFIRGHIFWTRTLN
jgi:hypothetical protein